MPRGKKGSGRTRPMPPGRETRVEERPCAGCGQRCPFRLERGQHADVALLCPACLAARVARVQAVPAAVRRRRRATP